MKYDRKFRYYYYQFRKAGHKSPELPSMKMSANNIGKQEKAEIVKDLVLLTFVGKETFLHQSVCSKKIEK